MITFTPLSGAARSSRTTPLSYLLQVDDVRILLDCGSPDWCPEEEATSSEVKEEDLEEKKYHWEQYCEALRQHAPTIDLVLLSHGDLAHSGLYPYAYSRWGLTAPAYTTLPVQAMARIAATEDVEGIRDEEDLSEESADDSEGSEDQQMEDETGEREKSATPKPKPRASGKYVATVQEVHDAFDSVNVLRYSQPCHLQGKCQGLTIIPHNAGHTLGGTIWKIRSPTAGTLLYAVNMNHMKERHLDGTVLMRSAATASVFETLQRPDLLITDADRANVTTARRKDRDAALLELLVLLDQHWNYSRSKYPICLLSRTGQEMLTFVRSMMEWLGGTVSKEDVGAEQDGNKKGHKRKRDDDNDEDGLGAFALRFPHLEIFPNPAALTQRYSSKDPKLILAIPASLSHGASRALFSEFAETPDNVVLLTGRGEEGTLGRILFDRWNDFQREESKWDHGKIGNNVMMDGVLHLNINSKVPLQGAELEEYLEKERVVKEKAAAKKAAEERRQRILEADEGESEEDEESDSDSEDESEVERALNGDGDSDHGAQHPREKKRRGTKHKDMDGGGWDMDIDGDEGIPKNMLSYDIYMKGNVSKPTSFFKTEGQVQRFRMFPYVERRRRVDEYGEVLDVGMWLRKGKALEEDAQDEEMKELKRLKAEEEAKKMPQEPPSKFITTQVEVQLACRLLFVDLEGLNDGRAVKTIIPQVNPRKMIVVHASSAATDHLLESYRPIH
ncbi:hypothetical protein NM688_g6496 [Phlebia brevispora]|uniref:Uncharacterized protein n=1 Tax=Phlebia brevispora TaxID=194682 RepID=A0ACC1SFC5_9APHY|nr:hypothetical protein NM688_g6496 [Phlebia brevispora]